MARVKSNKPILSISDWQQADKIIKKIGELQLRINSAEQRAADDIIEAKFTLQSKTKRFHENIEQLRISLEAFSVNNRADFDRAQSRTLGFGVLGWRKSTFIKIKKKTLELIKQIFKQKANTYIHIKETVDKEALAKLTDEQLADVQARRENREVFFVEPDLPEAVDYCE